MTLMAADKKGNAAMAYESTDIEGIAVGARNIAWIGDTRIKVAHVVKGWNGRSIDLPTIADRFGTTMIERDESPGGEFLRYHTSPIEYDQMLAAFMFYLRHREECDHQIENGEDAPVFNLWTGGQKTLYDAFMTPFRGGLLLLEGSLVAPSLAPSAQAYSGFRDELIEGGKVVDDQVVSDIEFGAQGLRKLTTLVTGLPNSGNAQNNVRWYSNSSVDRLRTLPDWQNGVP